MATDLVSSSVAAQMIGVSRQRVRQLVSEGALRALTVRRVGRDSARLQTERGGAVQEGATAALALRSDLVAMADVTRPQTDCGFSTIGDRTAGDDLSAIGLKALAKNAGRL